MKPEYRKVQLTGSSTYTVSLPHNWAKKQEIEKGSRIALLETSAGNLLLKPETETEKKLKDVKIYITPRMNIDFIVRLLITMYIQGYDEISIISDSYIQPNIKREIKSMAQKFIGLEPFGETSNELTFRILLSKEVNTIQAIQQMCKISLSSLNDLEGCIIASNEDLANDIIQRENEINKFYFLVLRQFSLESEFLQFDWIQIAKSVEMISDYIDNIARLTLTHDSSLIEEYGSPVLKLYSTLTFLYPKLIELIDEKNELKANEIIVKIEKMRKREERNLRELMTKDIDPHIILIHENLQRIGENFSEISDKIINLSKPPKVLKEKKTNSNLLKE
jgi:phosphate uptake regulator